MPDAGQQIFISYSREDVAFARDLRERLIALGHQPWMDLFDIPAGARCLMRLIVRLDQPM